MATTTTDVSRLKIAHPDFGYEAGVMLHSQDQTNWTKVGDNLGARVFKFVSQANGATVVAEHLFGLNLDQLEVFIFTGTIDLPTPNLVPIDDATNLAVPWAIAETGGSEKNSLDITMPASGGPFTGVVVVLQNKGAEVKAARTNRVVAASATLSNKRIHLADSTGGAITLTLPAPSTDLYIPIKDAGGDAAANNITIARAGAELIDGVAADYDLVANYEAVTVVSDGTNYFLI